MKNKTHYIVGHYAEEAPYFGLSGIDATSPEEAKRLFHETYNTPAEFVYHHTGTSESYAKIGELAREFTPDGYIFCTGSNHFVPLEEHACTQDGHVYCRECFDADAE